MTLNDQASSDNPDPTDSGKTTTDPGLTSTPLSIKPKDITNNFTTPVGSYSGGGTDGTPNQGGNDDDPPIRRPDDPGDGGGFVVPD